MSIALNLATIRLGASVGVLFHILRLPNLSNAVVRSLTRSSNDASFLLGAAALLRETDRTVLDIACQFGYDNASKFARAFRDVIGVSPREYRAGAEYDSCAPQLGEKPVSLSDADVERRI